MITRARIAAPSRRRAATDAAHIFAFVCVGAVHRAQRDRLDPASVDACDGAGGCTRPLLRQVPCRTRHRHTAGTDARTDQHRARLRRRTSQRRRAPPPYHRRLLGSARATLAASTASPRGVGVHVTRDPVRGRERQREAPIRPHPSRRRAYISLGARIADRGSLYVPKARCGLLWQRRARLRVRERSGSRESREQSSEARGTDSPRSFDAGGHRPMHCVGGSCAPCRRAPELELAHSIFVSARAPARGSRCRRPDARDRPVATTSGCRASPTPPRTRPASSLVGEMPPRLYSASADRPGGERPHPRDRCSHHQRVSPRSTGTKRRASDRPGGERAHPRDRCSHHQRVSRRSNGTKRQASLGRCSRCDGPGAGELLSRSRAIWARCAHRTSDPRHVQPSRRPSHATAEYRGSVARWRPHHGASTRWTIRGGASRDTGRSGRTQRILSSSRRVRAPAAALDATALAVECAVWIARSCVLREHTRERAVPESPPGGAALTTGQQLELGLQACGVPQRSLRACSPITRHGRRTLRALG